MGFIEEMTFDLRLETGEGFSQRLLGAECSKQRKQAARTNMTMHVHPWCEEPATEEE